MVIRETPLFSVWPTVSDSMLKPRRRNSDATRFRTPGLFSTYTTNVFIMALCIRGGLNQGVGPSDHVVQCRSRGNHGEDRIFLFLAEIQHHCAAMRARCPHRG